jgi:hypothetical protein
METDLRNKGLKVTREALCILNIHQIEPNIMSL